MDRIDDRDELPVSDELFWLPLTEGELLPDEVENSRPVLEAPRQPRRPGSWYWPSWALNRYGSDIEVNVQDDDGSRHWKPALPLARVVSEAGEDVYLTVQYDWDGESYVEEFAPEHVRRIGSRSTARDEVTTFPPPPRPVPGPGAMRPEGLFRRDGMGTKGDAPPDAPSPRLPELSPRTASSNPTMPSPRPCTGANSARVILQGGMSCSERGLIEPCLARQVAADITFDNLDRNRDGVLSRSEFREGFTPPSSPPLRDVSPRLWQGAGGAGSRSWHPQPYSHSSMNVTRDVPSQSPYHAATWPSTQNVPSCGASPRRWTRSTLMPRQPMEVSVASRLPSPPRSPSAAWQDPAKSMPELLPARTVNHTQLFDQLDTNADGVISRREFAALPELQRNQHRWCKRQMATPRRAMTPPPPPPTYRPQTGLRIDADAIFNMLDTNKDGLLSRHEFVDGVLHRHRLRSKTGAWEATSPQLRPSSLAPEYAVSQVLSDRRLGLFNTMPPPRCGWRGYM